MDKKKNEFRADFKILDQKVNGEPLVYLDNAATTQKPQAVIESLVDYYEHDNANVHRGVHTLAQRATQAYEATRQKVKELINADSEREVVYTKGTTESLNWIARGYAQKILQPGDEIVLSYAEHHSNIVPWQQVCEKTGAKLVYLDLNTDGQVDLENAKQLINEKTKIVSLAQVSNVLGAVNPIKELAQLAHKNGAIMVVDGAQSVPHMPVDVKELDIDFLAFSGHKMLGPTGTGILWGKLELLNQMSPLDFGGEMIDFVELEHSTFKEVPWKFEGGTQNIAGVIALGKAIDYLQAVGLANIAQHETELMEYVLPKLQAIDGFELYGSADPAKHAGIISFNLAGLHPHDTATALDMEGVAIRAGHHCAQPLMKKLQIAASARASFYLYNTKEDADKLVEALIKTREFFR
ncbi:MAG: cysteine desulfurase [Ligilactobacillus animalis]|uniref:cysteine desulfurase n=1 Tax=Ligilactobacillus animalis TaxID=1605 RepID=UPI00381172A7